MEPQEERRKFVRLNFLVDVAYRRHLSSEQARLSLARSISIGGTCLITSEELKEVDQLDLEIYLPQDKLPIKAVGRVVWAKEIIINAIAKYRRFEIGVEFQEVNQIDLSRINEFVFSHL